MTMTSALVGALSGSPILTVFVVIALGFLLGQVTSSGFGGGISEPLITVPEIVPTLGLVLFVYSMGVSSVRASRPRCTSGRLRIMACSEASP